MPLGAKGPRPGTALTAEAIRYRATWICQATLDALHSGIRYVWHEGGSRSGKTYNIAAALALYAAQTGYEVDVVRSSFPALYATAYADVEEVTRALGLYDPALHSRAPGNHRIGLKGGRGAFNLYSVDDEQKVRGRSRDVLWMNEANEISDEKRRQLWMRTRKQIVVDVNPTFDDEHWIAKKLERAVAEGRAVHFKSTYLDNPFLPAEQVREIEAMQYDDPYGWKIYGLGLRGSNPAAVFPSVELGPFDPQGDTVYGVDFGMKDPFVVVEIGWRDSNPPARPRATLYVWPLLHDTGLTTGGAIALLDEMGASRSIPMWCDSAEPDRILELQEAGYAARAVIKREGSRKAGYDWLKRHDVLVDPSASRCETVKNELRRTSHKKKPGSDTYSDEVADRDDHVADALRYGAFSTWGRTTHSQLFL